MEKYTSVMQVPRRKFQNGSLKMGHQLATDRKESISPGRNYKPSQRHLEVLPSIWSAIIHQEVRAPPAACPILQWTQLHPLRAMHLHIPASALSLKVDFEMEGSQANRNTFAQRPKLAANSWKAQVG